jgi:photosystem II stability/assembly factor-like uncharacterized protein
MKLFAVALALLFGVGQIEAQLLESMVVTNGTFVASSFINDSEGWLADNKGKLWHTANGGQIWDSVSLEKHFVKLQFTDALHGFALESDAAYETADGGHTWSELNLPAAIGRAIYFLNDETGFISGNQVIYKTINGGASWQTWEMENFSVHDFYFAGASTGIAVGRDDDQNRCVWRTADGGETWENVFNEENYYMNSVYFVNESIAWAAGYYGRAGMKEPAILKTTDGGITWQENYRYTGISSDGEALTDIRFKSATEGYALSVHNYDLYTLDGGETWNLVNDSDVISSTPVFGLYKTLDGYSDLYLAGKFGNVTMWK